MACRRGLARRKEENECRHSGLLPSHAALFAALAILLVTVSHCAAQSDQDCYLMDGTPKVCFPNRFSYPGSSLNWISNSTCVGSQGFCEEESSVVVCKMCGSDYGLDHLVDSDNLGMATSWQSGVLQSSSDDVTLTLPDRGAPFLLAGVVLQFSQLPSSFYIEKNDTATGRWMPMAYYARDCSTRYGLSPGQPSTPQPGCTDLTGSTDIRFLTVGTSGLTFEQRVLADQQFVDFINVNSIRLVLDDVNVPALAGQNSSFNYYRVSFARISGQTHCNGHGGMTSGSQCICQHNTAGKNCEVCKDFFNLVQWRKATESDPFECQPCNCNNRSLICENRGFFNNPVCINCTGNSTGANCQECQNGFYINPTASLTDTNFCLPCDCNGDGSTGSLCFSLPGTAGQCGCKPNVGGRRCDVCQSNAARFNSDPVNGCTACNCETSGTVNASPTCNNMTSQCQCKQNTEGLTCSTCQDGTYGLDTANPDGCTDCACRLGYATSFSCNATSGNCSCLPGFTGRRCEQVIAGRYVRSIDSIRLEAEDFSPAEYRLTTSTPYTGIGWARLAPTGNILLPGFAVPQTLSYCITVRYFSAQTAPVDLTVVRSDSSARYTITASSSANAANVATLMFSSSVVYDLTITTSAEVFIDSIVLVPQVTSLPIFGNSSNADGHLSFMASGCGSLPCSLSAAQSVSINSTCREILSLAMAELDQGTAACNCSSVGSNTSLSCDPLTGQCACLTGLTGRRCDRCARNFFSDTSSPTGCRRCDCDPLGADNTPCDIETGQCICQPGRTGRRCESCVTDFYQPAGGRACLRCSCNMTGSITTQCNNGNGSCNCKPGVEGQACDRCNSTFFNFSSSGCQSCNCHNVGASVDTCNMYSGQCTCRNLTVGRTCSQCANGSHFLHSSNGEMGCRPCNCSTHTMQCRSATAGEPVAVGTEICSCPVGYSGFSCERCASGYTRNNSNAMLVGTAMCYKCNCNNNGADTCDQITGNCTCQNNTVGDNCELCQHGYYFIGAGNANGCLLCGCDREGSLADNCTNNDGNCSCKTGSTGTKCNECLSTYYLDQSPTSNQPCAECRCDVTNTIASSPDCNQTTGQCRCRVGSEGQRCMVCSTGYYRDASSGCLPCQCNNHSNTCANATYCSACEHNTEGNQCQTCVAGYYGNAMLGRPGDCQQCDCNNWSSTCVPAGSSFQCDACTGNTTGDSCELCRPNFYGNPTQRVACRSCLEKCNNNSISCDSRTGECSVCEGNTDGTSCERCADNFFGNAKNASCIACQCHADGAQPLPCNHVNGTCTCRPNVVGDQCTACAETYFNISSGLGCESCNCNQTGARNLSCNASSGVCSCRDNVVGQLCDRCDVGTFDFTSNGCTSCHCNISGTVGGGTTCNSVTGQCNCEAGTNGSRCDSCLSGFFWTPTGCTPCECNNRSTTCDPVSGVCSGCTGNTTGPSCQSCKATFYRHASGECVPCACHPQGAVNRTCNELTGQCTCHANVASSSRTCSVCQDHYYNITAACKACSCHAIGTEVGSVCNNETGECVCKTSRLAFNGTRCDRCSDRFYDFQAGCPACGCDNGGSTSQVCEAVTGNCSCQMNVEGRQCDRCSANFYGFSDSPVNCRSCGCHPLGSFDLQCNESGNCTCRPGVNGTKCDQCQDGFYDLTALGCMACNCHPNGSMHGICDKVSGQCPCLPNIRPSLRCGQCQDGTYLLPNIAGCTNCTCNQLGVTMPSCDGISGQCPCKENITGMNCGRCVDNHFNYPQCTACNCDRNGSVNGLCDVTGRCVCRPNAVGLKCDACEENFLLGVGGCASCPSCYGITERQVNSVRERLNTSIIILDRILADPLVVRFLTRQSNLTNLTTALLDMITAANNTEQRTLSAANTTRVMTQNYTSRYPPPLNEPFAAYAQRAHDLTDQTVDVQTDILFAGGATLESNRSLLEAYNKYTMLINLTTEIEQHYRRVVDLVLLEVGVLGNVTTVDGLLAQQATQLNISAYNAMAASLEAERTANQSETQAEVTSVGLADTNISVSSTNLSSPAALAASQAAQMANTAAQSARGNTSVTLALPSTLLEESASAVYTAEASQLTNHSQNLMTSNRNNVQSVNEHAGTVAELRAAANKTDTLSGNFSTRAQAALQTTQAAASDARRAIGTAEDTLAVLSNFSLRSQEARNLSNRALGASASIAPMAADANTTATTILSNHRNASADASAAANSSSAAAYSLQSAEKVSNQQNQNTSQVEMQLRDLNANLTQLNISGKSQAAENLNSTCTVTSGEVTGIAMDVAAGMRRAQSTNSSAQRAQTAAQQLETDLANIATLPLESLERLESQLQNVRSILTPGQVDAMISGLQKELWRREAAYTQQEMNLRSMEVEAQALMEQQQALTKSCRQQTSP